METDSYCHLPFHHISSADLAALYASPQGSPAIGHITSSAPFRVSPLFPDSVLVQISTYLSSHQRTLSSLALTCKAAHVLLVPILYSRIRLNATNAGWITYGLLPVPIRWLEGDIHQGEDPLTQITRPISPHHHRLHLPRRLDRRPSREDDATLFTNPDPFVGHAPSSNGHMPRDRRFLRSGFLSLLEKHGREYTTKWLRHKLACLRWCTQLRIEDLPDADALCALELIIHALLPKRRRKHSKVTRVLFPGLKCMSISAQALSRLNRQSTGYPSLAAVCSAEHLCVTIPDSGRTLSQWRSLYGSLDRHEYYMDVVSWMSEAAGSLRGLYDLVRNMPLQSVTYHNAAYIPALFTPPITRVFFSAGFFPPLGDWHGHIQEVYAAAVGRLEWGRDVGDIDFIDGNEARKEDIAKMGMVWGEIALSKIRWLSKVDAEPCAVCGLKTVLGQTTNQQFFRGTRMSTQPDYYGGIPLKRHDARQLSVENWRHRWRAKLTKMRQNRENRSRV